MQNRAIIYNIPQKIEATLLNGERSNFPMFRKNLKIFRGVDNSIDFELKDVFRIPVKLTNQDLKCIVTNPFNHELMLVKYLTIKDANNGIYELKLTVNDVQYWSSGEYNFCVTTTDVNGIETLFYTTQDQDVTGTFELIDKPFPEFVPSHLFKSEDFVMTSYNNLNTILQQTISTPSPTTIDFVTRRVPGNAQKNTSAGVGTFSLLLNHFTGKFYLQGNLEANPLDENGWFNIPFDPTSSMDYAEYDADSGMYVFNFDGNYTWLRFKFEIVIFNYGRVEKVWLKV